MKNSPDVEELLHRLAPLDPERRAEYFKEHPTDPNLRREVETLLASDEWSDSRLREFFAFTSGLMAGMVCGPYRLREPIGRGGMGEVWLAERVDGLIKRPVALKLPSSGIHAPQFAERAHRERDILAGLVHPGIARLYDAGVSDDGRPFLALEYVEGINLTTYCEERRLPLHERLNLFLQILGAVQYAHSRLVIHRDLKPSNILVTAKGEVKLLDFGIAKLMTEGEAAETELTRLGGRALTLHYASPEQISGQAVTTASDVFTLGIVLCELLAGARPFVPKRDTNWALEEAVLTLDARRPSQSVTSEAQAWARSTTVRKLKAALEGDLDQIVLKALEKNPERRYPTADAFRADIERYLAGEAVEARPASGWYRLQKFVRRNKLAVASAAAVMFALAAGLSVALWQARIAHMEARTSSAVEEFITDIFRANSRDHPDPLKARQTTARELLDIGVKKIDGSLRQAPAAKLKMLDLLGSLYLDLGLNDQAVKLHKQQVALAKQFYGARSAKVVPAMIDLARALHASRSVNERETLLLEAKSILDDGGDFGSETRGELLAALSEHYSSTNAPKSLQFAQESVIVLRKWPPSGTLTSALYGAGLAYHDSGRFDEAEKVLLEAIELSRKLNGDPNGDLPRYYTYAAETEDSLLRFDAAEKNFRLALEAARKLGGDAEVDTLEVESRLGNFLAGSSRSREGRQYLAKAKNDCIQARGADDPFYTPQMLMQYGMAVELIGRPEEALEAITEAVENRRKNRPGTRYLGQMLEDQAFVLTELGRYPKAEQLLAEAAEIRKKVDRRMDGNFLIARIRLSLAQGHTKEADEWIHRYMEPVPQQSSISVEAFRNLEMRAKSALAKNDGHTAVQMSERILEIMERGRLEEHLKARQIRALAEAGRGYLQMQNAAKAQPLLEKAVESGIEMHDPNSPELATAEASLGMAYLRLNDRSHARALLARAQARLASHKELSDMYKQPVRELAEQIKH